MRTQITSNIADIQIDVVSATRKSNLSMADEATMKLNGQMLNTLNQAVPPLPINGFASLVNFAPSADRPIHRWFWYREGYSLDLVKELISELPRGSVVLDPFCGAGTTLLASREIGLPSVGFDVNPISIIVSKVKTTPLTVVQTELLTLRVGLLKKADITLPADPKPIFKIIDKVFDAKILQALLIFRKIINSTNDEGVRDFLFVAWLSIVEGVSNVYKEGNGIKYKNRRRTDDGYISVDMSAWNKAVLPDDRLEFVKQRLLKKIEQMTKDLEFMPVNSAEVRIHEAGAESLTSHMAPNSAAMALFSPPYCNCFNYFKMYKVELWMGGFVNSYEDLRLLNRRGLRSHVETILKKPDDIVESNSEEYAKLLDGLDLWDRRIPNAVRGYFIDMAKVLQELHTVLKPSAKCVIVVGNSAYGGVVIPTDALLAKIGKKVGFTVKKLAVARALTTSSQQRAFLGERMESLRESIVILEKVDPRLEDKELISTEELPQDDTARRGNVFAIRNAGLTANTHKFHRYPGKFIPHIPRWAIQRYLGDEAPRKIILDPFCGSGTTLVEASTYGVKSFGIDVDPIARLVSKVKTTPINSTDLNDLVSAVKKKLSKKGKAFFRPQILTLNHWFSDAAIQDLGMIRDVIETFRTQPDHYDFLMICFAAIIRRASNADNQTQKTYVSHTKIKEIEPAQPLFIKTLEDYAVRLGGIRLSTGKFTPTILGNCDALTFADLWKEKNYPKVDLIVSSPPYLNSVDYVYNQMAEYFWIGDLFDLETQPKQNEHKRNYVGTTKVDASEYRSEICVGIDSIDEVVKAVRAKSEKNAYIVAKYFKDMRIHFEQSAQTLVPGGKYVSVVGDSLVSGESIPVHQYVAECAEAAGFNFDGVFGYEIRNRHMRFPRMGRGGIVRYDWVLELTRKY